MPQIIDIETFLQKRKEIPVIDVRSPAEYAQGHIPGAVNIPLFNDEERKIVGTKYKKENKESAMFAALGIVGPKMVALAKTGMKAARNKELLVHCWRGGMRSAGMAWLFENMGIRAWILDGGYRTYRRYIREFISQPFDLIILGGSTGSGKTAILQELAQRGEQITDLEGLACHKGSAFGALGEEPQPTTEHFENLLADDLLRINPAKRLWLEDESRNIGKCVIPEPFFFRMREAPIIELKVKREIRAARLVTEYGKYPDNELIACIEKISRRIGGDKAREAVEAIGKKDYFTTAMITLHYYDKSYAFSLEKNHPGKKIVISSGSTDPSLNTDLVLETLRSGMR